MKGKTILWIVAGVLALGMLGPTAAHKLGEVAARGGADAAKGATGAAAGAATESATNIPETVCPAGLAGLRCAAPISHPVDMANLARAKAARAQQATPPTTMPPQPPEPKPYGPGTGRPYVAPAAPAPPPPPPATGSGRPQIGEAPTGGPLGEALEAVPAIGPAVAQALTQGLKALPPASAP